MQKQYQRDMVAKFGGRILNAACKEDPSKLGQDFGAVNVDIESYDPHTNTRYEDIPNFLQASVYELPFDDEAFDTIVLGEFIEHCPERAVREALLALRRVLSDDGHLILTFPYDTRPKDVQHAGDKLLVWDHEYDITSWHQSSWTDDKFLPIVAATGFQELTEHRQLIDYSFCDGGCGCVLRKVLE